MTTISRTNAPSSIKQALLSADNIKSFQAALDNARDGFDEKNTKLKHQFAPGDELELLTLDPQTGDIIVIDDP